MVPKYASGTDNYTVCLFDRVDNIFDVVSFNLLGHVNANLSL